MIQQNGTLPQWQASPLHGSGARWRGSIKTGAVGVAVALLLAACNDNGDKPTTAALSSSAPPATASATPPVQATQTAYTPPSADVLYQMVAPIALYPDKLVGQVLAGATYPDQISAAEVWLGQNPGLQGNARSSAANEQPWDPSIKSLTLFPNVLEQMASNLPWTTALGKAYYNDPTDVLNAIQVMRGRANKAGTLKSTKELKVHVASEPPVSHRYEPAQDVVVHAIPDPVIPPPAEYIQISEPSPETVYVPHYNPSAVYGEPVPVYSGYQYAVAPPPPPVVTGVVATPVVAGLIGFGAGVVITQAIQSHPWGWNAWNVHWGGADHWRRGDPPPPPTAWPAVVYNHSNYVSRSTTVVENVQRVTNITNITNNNGSNNNSNNNSNNTHITEINRGQPQPQSPVPSAQPAFDHGAGLHAAGLAAGAAAVGAGTLAAAQWGRHEHAQPQGNPPQQAPQTLQATQGARAHVPSWPNDGGRHASFASQAQPQPLVAPAKEQQLREHQQQQMEQQARQIQEAQARQHADQQRAQLEAQQHQQQMQAQQRQAELQQHERQQQMQQAQQQQQLAQRQQREHEQRMQQEQQQQQQRMVQMQQRAQAQEHQRQQQQQQQQQEQQRHMAQMQQQMQMQRMAAARQEEQRREQAHQQQVMAHRQGRDDRRDH